MPSSPMRVIEYGRAVTRQLLQQYLAKGDLIHTTASEANRTPVGRGNRFFVGTVTFDGRAGADEAILPAFSTMQCEVDGRVALASRINWLASPARIVAERVKSMSL